MKNKRIFLFILFTLILPKFSLPLYAQDSNQKEIIKKQKDLGELQKKIKESQKKKEEAQKKEKVATKDLKKIETELKSRKKELSIYEWNLEKNKREKELVHSWLKKLADKQKDFSSCLIEEFRIRFKESLRPQFLTVPNNLGKLAIYSSLEDIVDSRLISFGEKLNEEINSKEVEIEKLEKFRDLELTYKKVAETKEEKAKAIQKDRKRLLSRYQRQKKEQEEKLKDYKEQVLALESMIKNLEKEQRLTGGFRGGYFPKSKGKLLMPVNGTLVKARYGESLNIYKGVMITAPKGSKVLSVADGQIVYGDWFRGFGNIVIIDHGDGYSTLYAHLDEILVRPGDNIGEGQVIATVGDSGSLTNQPRLYFEIRRYGESLEPLEWLGSKK